MVLPVRDRDLPQPKRVLDAHTIWENWAETQDLYTLVRQLVEKGFVIGFLRVQQAVGLNSSCHAAQAKEEELLENTLQNLLHNLPPQTVEVL